MALMGKKSSLFCVVFVTAPEAKTAQDLAQKLIKQRLAACVNIIPGVTSVYRWEERIHKDPELLLIIKTRTNIFKKLAQFIKKNHPAEVPEIISLPINEGSPSYMSWLADNTNR